MSLPFLPLASYGTLSNCVGSGTYGDVFILSEQHVAKRLPFVDGLLGSENLSEICHLIALRGARNILQIVDLCFDARFAYIVFRKERGDLNDTGLQMGVCNRMLCLALAVQEMHRRSLVHLDIKPANILVTATKTNMLLADLGSSCYLFGGDSLSGETTTLWFRAPEMFVSGDYDFPADIWSLGCIFWYLLYENYLFRGDNEAEYLREVLRFVTPTKEDKLPEAVLALAPKGERQGDRLRFLLDKSDYRDLICGMLVLNPEKRMTIADVVQYLGGEVQPVIHPTLAYTVLSRSEEAEAAIRDFSKLAHEAGLDMRQMCCAIYVFDHLKDSSGASEWKWLCACALLMQRFITVEDGKLLLTLKVRNKKEIYLLVRRVLVERRYEIPEWTLADMVRFYLPELKMEPGIYIIRYCTEVFISQLVFLFPLEELAKEIAFIYGERLNVSLTKKLVRNPEVSEGMLKLVGPPTY